MVNYILNKLHQHKNSLDPKIKVKGQISAEKAQHQLQQTITITVQKKHTNTQFSRMGQHRNSLTASQVTVRD